MKRSKLPVVFRVIKGELLAIFPTIASRRNYTVECCSFEEGWCDVNSDYLRGGRLATPEEYASFLKRMQEIRCDDELVVRKRMNIIWS